MSEKKKKHTRKKSGLSLCYSDGFCRSFTEFRRCRQLCFDFLELSLNQVMHFMQNKTDNNKKQANRMIRMR